MAIYIFSIHQNYIYTNKRKLYSWIKTVIHKENKKYSNIDICLVDDDHILATNNEFLKHNYTTDIITFDYSENNILQGELYISIDTVLENSKRFKVDFNTELHRVIIHGILHLCGYKDKTKKDFLLMKKKENEMLDLWK